MSTSPNNQRTIATHAVLTGLTPLIPVPVVDDLAKNYFRRRLVRNLAAAHARTLGAADVEALAAELDTGCLTGCVGTVVVYPLKKIFRKIFFVLEWKRAVDLASRTYHFGYLVDYLLAERLDESSGRSASEIGAAIDAVCREAPIKPLEAAVGATFRQSKSVLASGAGLLERSFRRIAGRARASEVESAVEAVEAEEERQIEGVVTRLQRSVEAIPEEHFSRLRRQLAARLARHEPSQPA